jgi:hypothetical protein
MEIQYPLIVKLPYKNVHSPDLVSIYTMVLRGRLPLLWKVNHINLTYSLLFHLSPSHFHFCNYLCRFGRYIQYVRKKYSLPQQYWFWYSWWFGRYSCGSSHVCTSFPPHPNTIFYLFIFLIFLLRYLYGVSAISGTSLPEITLPGNVSRVISNNGNPTTSVSEPIILLLYHTLSPSPSSLTLSLLSHPLPPLSPSPSSLTHIILA